MSKYTIIRNYRTTLLLYRAIQYRVPLLYISIYASASPAFIHSEPTSLFAELLEDIIRLRSCSLLSPGLTSAGAAVSEPPLVAAADVGAADPATPAPPPRPLPPLRTDPGLTAPRLAMILVDLGAIMSDRGFADGGFSAPPMTPLPAGVPAVEAADGAAALVEAAAVVADAAAAAVAAGAAGASDAADSMLVCASTIR